MKRSFTMTGLKTNSMTREQVLSAVLAIPNEKNFAWDGADEDERPLSKQEMRTGMAIAKQRGRPAGTATTEQIAIRVNKEALTRWRATGKGWQTRAAKLLETAMI
jgi:uncharacterized protein (DUF4415 family)